MGGGRRGFEYLIARVALQEGLGHLAAHSTWMQANANGRRPLDGEFDRCGLDELIESRF